MTEGAEVSKPVDPGNGNGQGGGSTTTQYE